MPELPNTPGTPSPSRESQTLIKSLRSSRRSAGTSQAEAQEPVAVLQSIIPTPSEGSELSFCIAHCRNARGLGKNVVVFRLFKKLRYSDERSTKFESPKQDNKYLEEENDKMIAFQISLNIESLYGLGRQAKKLQGFVWNFATFARLPFEQFSAEKSQT